MGDESLGIRSRHLEVSCPSQLGSNFVASTGLRLVRSDAARL